MGGGVEESIEREKKFAFLCSNKHHSLKVNGVEGKAVSLKTTNSIVTTILKNHRIPNQKWRNRQFWYSMKNNSKLNFITSLSQFLPPSHTLISFF